MGCGLPFRLRVRLSAASAVGLTVFWPALALAQATDSADTKKDSTAVEGVTVQAVPQSAVRTSIDRRSYSVSGDLQGSGGSVADALRNIPGAEVDPSGNLSLRGANVTVMIDGQPSQLFSGKNGAQALEAMSADRIERVEVITNPTAAMSPDGQGGVINLITKKNAPAGVTGSIRANAGSTGHDNTGADLTYMNGKLTVSADGALRKDNEKLQIDTTGAIADPTTGQTDTRAQHEVVGEPYQSANSHLGFDYQLDPKTKLSGEARYNAFWGQQYDDYNFLTAAPGGAPIGAYTRLSNVGWAQATASGQMTLHHQLDGDGHTLDLFYNHTRIDYHYDYPATDLTTVPPPTSSSFLDQAARYPTDTDEFKADYVRPMTSMGQLKVGYDLKNTVQSIDGSALSGPTEATATPNSLFANLFSYGQLLHAAYTTYEQPLGDFTLLGGVRLEDEHLSLRQSNPNTDVERDDLQVFPSVHMTYKATGETQWVLGYSSRIQRPTLGDLDPWLNMGDPYNYYAGNTLLRPEVTQSIEGGWQYRKGAASYLATLFYRQSEDGVSNAVTDLGGGVLLYQRENLSSSRTAGFELVAAAPLFKTLSYNLSTDVYWNEIRAPAPILLQTSDLITASGRLSFNWNPTKIDLFQANFQLNAGRLNPEGHVDPLYFMYFGYRHKFSNKFTLTAQAQDPFDLVRQDTYLDGAGLDQHTAIRIHIRSFMLGFTYNFGGSGKAGPDKGIDFAPSSNLPGG